MSRWIVPPVAGLIEPAIAPEFYCTGIGAIERHDGHLRLWMSAYQLMLDDPTRPPSQIVVVKLVRPIIGLASTIGYLAQCMSDVPGIVPEPVPPQGPWPRLVT